MREQIRLDLPMPLTQNAKNRLQYGNRAQYVRTKNKYKRSVWQTAIDQVQPFSEHLLPMRVRVHAEFVVKRKRDEDKLPASLEWVLDVLKVNQSPEERRKTKYTKDGFPLWPKRGYMLDDDPAHMELVVEQRNPDKESGEEPHLTLWITPV